MVSNGIKLHQKTGTKGRDKQLSDGAHVVFFANCNTIAFLQENECVLME